MNVSSETRALAARVAELRADGLTHRQVAARLGIRPAWASSLANDPDGVKRDQRRARYRGTCGECGAPTNSDGTSRPSKRCHPCGARQAGEEAKVWTRHRLLTAIRWWAAAYGEPPASNDWNATLCRFYSDECRAARFEQLHAQGRIPWFSVVVREFGSWNAAIRAAGFEPRPPGIVANRHRLRSERRKQTAGRAVAASEATPPIEEMNVSAALLPLSVCTIALALCATAGGASVSVLQHRQTRQERSLHRWQGAILFVRRHPKLYY